MKKWIFDIAGVIAMSLTVITACREDIFIYPEVVPNSYVYVNSDPPGAKIYHKGVDLSLTTPAWISNVESGLQVFTLKFPGYIDSTFTVSVEDSSQKYVKIFLKEE